MNDGWSTIEDPDGRNGFRKLLAAAWSGIWLAVGGLAAGAARVLGVSVDSAAAVGFGVGVLGWFSFVPLVFVICLIGEERERRGEPVYQADRKSLRR